MIKPKHRTRRWRRAEVRRAYSRAWHSDPWGRRSAVQIVAVDRTAGVVTFAFVEQSERPAPTMVLADPDDVRHFEPGPRWT